MIPREEQFGMTCLFKGYKSLKCCSRRTRMSKSKCQAEGRPKYNITRTPTNKSLPHYSISSILLSYNPFLENKICSFNSNTHLKHKTCILVWFHEKSNLEWHVYLKDIKEMRKFIILHFIFYKLPQNQIRPVVAVIVW